MAKYQYSYSAIDWFLKCPLYFKLKRIKKAKEADNPLMRIGRVAHDVFGDYSQHCVENSLPTDVDKLVNIVDNYRGELPDNEWQEVKQLAQNFGQTHVFSPGSNEEIMVEERLAFDESWELLDDWFHNETFFRAIMDKFHIEEAQKGRTGVITDYKTGWKVPAQSQVEDSLQLKIYAYIGSLLFPEVERFLVRLDFVRYNTIRKSVYSREEAESFGDIIMNYIEKIEETEKFKANPGGKHCELCGFSGKCQAFQDYLEETGEDEVTEQNAPDLAKRYRILRTEVGKLKKKLRTYVKSHGDIEVGNQELGFNKVEKNFINDTRGVVQFLGKNGVPKDKIWEALYTNMSSIKKALRKADKMDLYEQVVEEFATTRVETHFKYTKAKGEDK